MRFLTVKKAQEFRSKQTRIDESVIIKTAESASGKNCFLSHSTKDKEHLADVIAFLQGFGAKVYIDKEDDLLPKTTSRQTAEGLKRRINECKRLVILASTNSKNSRWIPWEIGLADAIKDIASIAILPLTATDNESPLNWPEQEYFCLYRQIVETPVKGYDSEQWMALDLEKKSGTLLSDWFK